MILLIVTVLRAGRSARNAEALSRQMSGLGQAVQVLGQGQDQLTGGLRTVSDAQANAQTQTVQVMEARLAEVQRQMQERLHENALRSARALSDMQERMNETLKGSTVETTQSLTQLQERLATIDKAQENITRLSGDVLSLQDILSNKQTRGAFGEIQLTDIVSKALPKDSYVLQATLSNGKRADCLIHLPNPPGPIVIDSKFPLEAYEALAQRRHPMGAERGGQGAAGRGARAYQGDLGEIHHRRRDGGRRADVPALRGGLCRAARELSPRWCATGSTRGSGSCRPPPAWPRSTRCGRS